MSPFVPFGHRVFFLRPFQAQGETDTGILLQHHDKLPPIYGRVTQTHPSCRDVRVGDWVVYAPNRPTRVKTREGSLYVLDETQVLGVVEAGDGHPWFDPPVGG
jgi:co-chaperonin GroES (HSP10)